MQDAICDNNAILLVFLLQDKKNASEWLNKEEEEILAQIKQKNQRMLNTLDHCSAQWWKLSMNRGTLYAQQNV